MPKPSENIRYGWKGDLIIEYRNDIYLNISWDPNDPNEN